MRFLRAVRYALAGIGYGIRTQRHLRFHLIAAVAAVVMGFIVSLTLVQWAILLLTIAVVISAELINTAIESVVDLVSPDHHHLAKAAKDTAAGAVLVVAMTAIIIGFLLFLPLW